MSGTDSFSGRELELETSQEEEDMSRQRDQESSKENGGQKFQSTEISGNCKVSGLGGAEDGEQVESTGVELTGRQHRAAISAEGSAKERIWFSHALTHTQSLTSKANYSSSHWFGSLFVFFFFNVFFITFID